MKSEEVEDYIRLIFNKYLKYIPHLIIIITSIIVFFLLLAGDGFNMDVLISWLSFRSPTHFVPDKLEFAMATSFYLLILFYCIKYILISLPRLFKRVKGDGVSLFQEVKNDVSSIHDKHNPLDDDKYNIKK